MDSQETLQLGPIAWKTLFGEAVEDTPDPNKPENSAYINKKLKGDVEEFKRFAEGTGSILFKKWQIRVRSGVFEIMNPMNVPECNCKLSNDVKELQFLFKLLAEAQAIIETKNLG